jgi:DNA polymerase-3 subunit delta
VPVSGPRYLRADGTPAPVYLIAGEDAGLVNQELLSVVEELAALESVPGMVEEYGEAGHEDELAIGPILDACRTPPFLSDRRLIVVRDIGGLALLAQRELASYLAEPLDTTVLVLALVGRRVPKAVQDAVAKAGTILAAEPASGARGRQKWFADHLADAPVRLDAAAASHLDRHLGGDLARLEPMLEALASAYGEHARISLDELEPFLGTAGDSTPWDLTDALAEGDTAAALAALQRQLHAGRHPLQVLATLHRHYGALLRLDGAEISGEGAAASATGLAPFPARKALELSRRLGHERVGRAISLIAGADLDLRGRVDWPDELVVEVLVARLAQLSRLRGGGARTTARRPPAGRGAAARR